MAGSCAAMRTKAPPASADAAAASLFDDLFAIVPQYPKRHATTDEWWQRWSAAARTETENMFGEGADPAASLHQAAEEEQKILDKYNAN